MKSRRGRKPYNVETLQRKQTRTPGQLAGEARFEADLIGDISPEFSKTSAIREWEENGTHVTELRRDAGEGTFESPRTRVRERRVRSPGRREYEKAVSREAAELRKSAELDPLDEFLKEAQSVARPTRREFAPGIPQERIIRPIPKVKEKSENVTWQASLSRHPAARRGDHDDLRIIDDKGRAHSWALQNMPEPGRSTYAIQQPTHSRRYALRTEPFVIPPGYGATRPGAKVEPKYVQEVEVVTASDDKLRVLRHHGQQTEELVLRRIADPPRGGPVWVINNATRNRRTGEGAKIPDFKPRHKEVPLSAVNPADDGEVMTAKIDGAHTITHLHGPDKMTRVYSYRPTQRDTGLIEHTFKFPGFQNRKSAPSLKGTMLRTETWASKDGKAVPVQELAGLLNSSVPKARRELAERGIQLRQSIIDVIRHRGKDVSRRPYGEKLRIMEEAAKGAAGLELPPVARTQAEKKKMLADITAGRRPETREGVVLERLHEAAPPTKAVRRPLQDVYVRKIFAKERTKAKGQAAGFAYSHTPDGPVVGRVGTGFSAAMRKDMAVNPDRYVGRVARVASKGSFGGQALRAPAFKDWHPDKNDPELMKEADVRPDSQELKTVMERLSTRRALAAGKL